MRWPPRTLAPPPFDRWTLALLRSWEVYGNASYLAAAETIFADLVGPWNALNTTCGGMNWERGNDYVNAITNELFFTAAARLALITGSRQPVGGKTYLQWAQEQWAWLQQSAMVQPSGLFQVRLTPTPCPLTAPGLHSPKLGQQENPSYFHTGPKLRPTPPSGPTAPPPVSCSANRRTLPSRCHRPSPFGAS